MADEIRAVLADPEKLNAVCKAVFDSVDTDGSGAINSSELKNALTSLASECGIEAPTQEQCDSAYKALDTNSDGKVSLSEFSVLVTSILQSLVEA